MASPNLGDALRAKVRDGATVPPAARAPLVEIFHSIQGEGRFAGVPMVFVRTATCPIRCLYCDTPHSYKAEPQAKVVLGPRTVQEPNPVAADRAAELCKQVTATAGMAGKTPRVSVTGGEPLAFPDFVAALGARLRAQNYRLHLETAALDPEALAKCIAQVDHLSADYKLPETVEAGPKYGQQHLKCCQVAIQRGASVDVKIVLTNKVGDLSFEQALADLAPVREKIVLVLQPVTPFGAVTGTVARAELERFAASAGRAGFDFRVLPQVHRQLQLP